MQATQGPLTRSWDLVGFVVLILLTVTLPGMIVHSEIEDRRQREAFTQIESVATRLAHQSQREPAATKGEVDPWGRRLHIEYLTNERRPTHVGVWSAGPNGIFESRRSKTTAQWIFTGDDVGIAQEIPHSP